MNTQPDTTLLARARRATLHRLQIEPESYLALLNLLADEIVRLTAQPAPVAAGDVLRGEMMHCMGGIVTVSKIDPKAIGWWLYQPVVILAADRFDQLNKAQPAPVSWIKTSERLPDQTTPVYFVMRGNVMHGMFGDCLFHGEIGAFNPREVSHWQPWTLPAQPAPVTEAEAYRRLDALGVKLNAVKSHAHDIVSLVSEVTADASKLAALNRAAAGAEPISQGGDVNDPVRRTHSTGFDTPAPTQCQRGAGEPASDLPNWVGTKQVSGPESDSFVMREAAPTPQPSAEELAHKLEVRAKLCALREQGETDRQAAALLRIQAREIEDLKRIGRIAVATRDGAREALDAALARAEKAERELVELTAAFDATDKGVLIAKINEMEATRDSEIKACMKLADERWNNAEDAAATEKRRADAAEAKLAAAEADKSTLQLTIDALVNELRCVLCSASPRAGDSFHEFRNGAHP